MPRVEAEVGSAANSYEILAKLATGGMAEIFLARGASTAGVERYVVLKRILRHRADDQAFVRMFLDEARLAAQLQHPNIAQVYDIGKLGDSYFFTMEYVHGETVRALLQRSHALRSPIPVQAVLVIAAGSAAGLHHAHERNGFDGRPLGIVHRDVSPSNLMSSYEGGVKVVDFGVAKAAHRSQETRSGTVKGKIAYLSPEQCRGGIVDRRSDLFSLGIVLWEMLTTERLYKRATVFEAMAAIVNEEVVPPSLRRPGIPPELDAIVLRLLAKDPAARFQTADELNEAIENTAVRIGMALSSASLARFLRDLFGQRPEPWIEMQSRETHPEAFTVTSEPIPVDLGIRPADEFDMKLGAVPDLSFGQDSNDDLVRRPSSEVGPMTLPFPAQPAPVQHPTANLRAPASQSSPPPYGPTVPMPTVPGSGPQLQHSHSYPSISDYPSYAPSQPEAPLPPPPARTPRWVMFAAAGAAIALGLSIAIAVRSGSKVSTGEPAAVAPADAELAAVVPADAAVVAVVATPDASAPAVVAPEPADAATVEVAEVVADAAVATTTAPDAGVVATPKRPRPRHDDTPADELAKQIAAGHYADAVATCAANSAAMSTMAASCVVAACHTHETSKAKRWLASAPASKRAALSNACKAEGTPLEAEKVDKPDKPDKSAKPDCVADPMACQH